MNCANEFFDPSVTQLIGLALCLIFIYFICKD